MRLPQGRRRDELGLVRGCCLGVVVLAIVLSAGTYVGVRVVSRPDLGAAPAGVRHGGTPEAVATAIAAALGSALLSRPHGVALLSERDLTVIARGRNPAPTHFRDPDVRIRDGLVVIAAANSAGPFLIATVARLRISLRQQDGVRARVVTELVGVELGQLDAPSWARNSVGGWSSDALSLEGLLADSPAFLDIRPNVDCLAVAPDGVRIGVHRMGSPSEPMACQAVQAAIAAR